jgi:hypothetical protein
MPAMYQGRTRSRCHHGMLLGQQYWQADHVTHLHGSAWWRKDSCTIHPTCSCMTTSRHNQHAYSAITLQP